MAIRTRLGGTVSVCAPVAASRATRSPGLAPRAFISGNSTATAAMSAAFKPDTPDTRCIAPTSTSGDADKYDDQMDIAERPAATATPTGLIQEPVEPGSAHSIWNDIYLTV
jgi:hypothetical protein